MSELISLRDNSLSSCQAHNWIDFGFGSYRCIKCKEITEEIEIGCPKIAEQFERENGTPQYEINDMPTLATCQISNKSNGLEDD